MIEITDRKIQYLQKLDFLSKQAYNEKKLYDNIKLLNKLKSYNLPIEVQKLSKFDKVFKNLEEIDQKIEIINNQKISLENFLFEENCKFIDSRKLEYLLFETHMKAFQNKNEYFQQICDYLKEFKMKIANQTDFRSKSTHELQNFVFEVIQFNFLDKAFMEPLRQELLQRMITEY